MRSRRSFLARAATLPLAAVPGAATAGVPDLSGHRNQVRVVDVRAYSVRRATFVQVVADDGTSGWGEAGHSGGSLVARVLLSDDVQERVIGADVFSAEPTWARVFYEIDELGPGGLASQALAGLDCALWDLRGKLLGVPVWALLGGKFREEIPLYGSFSRSLGGDERMTPAQAAAKAAELVDEGFRVLKVRLAIREEGADPDPDPAVPTMRAVRDAVGDDVELYVDANNGYTPARAVQVGRALYERFGVTTFEEPVAAYHYASLRQVADELEMLVTAGEHEYTKWAFRDLILEAGVDVINPDVSKLAGLTEAKKVAALAEVFDVPIAVHNARPTLLTAAHLHYIASCQTAYRPQEHPGRRRLEELWQYFDNQILADRGTIRIPDAPGLGLEPNVAALERDNRL